MNKEYIDLKRRIVYRGEVYQAIEDERIKTLPAVLNNRYMDGVHDGLKNALRALEKVNDISAADVVEYEEVENLLRWAVLHDWTWEEAQDHLQRLRAKMDGGVNDGKTD